MQADVERRARHRSRHQGRARRAARALHRRARRRRGPRRSPTRRRARCSRPSTGSPTWRCGRSPSPTGRCADEAGRRRTSRSSASWSTSGMVGIIDPPRDGGSRGDRRGGRGAGVRVIMITGDHPRTAARIAGDLGIVAPGARVLTGAELEATRRRRRCAAAVREVSVYARVAPEHKLRIVDALQCNGEHRRDDRRRRERRPGAQGCGHRRRDGDHRNRRDARRRRT